MCQEKYSLMVLAPSQMEINELNAVVMLSGMLNEFLILNNLTALTWAGEAINHEPLTLAGIWCGGLRWSDQLLPC